MKEKDTNLQETTEKTASLGVQREHKSKLFNFLFGREEYKEWALSLYNAVSGRNHKNKDDLILMTLEDVLYFGMKDDVAFIVSEDVLPFQVMQINEEQSTFNRNMPIRIFMYAARLYEKYLTMGGFNKYGTKLIPLPVPKLMVFYNGTTERPDEEVLSLRDAFLEGIQRNLQAQGIPEGDVFPAAEAYLEEADPDIDVRVRVLNINYGRNREFLERCQPLKEYAWFVDGIRKLKSEGMELLGAVDTALARMPDDFEIKAVLKAHQAEVRNMWLTEYNEEEARQASYAEGLEEGESKFGKLVSFLLSAGRIADVQAAAVDAVRRNALYMEMGMN